jgi:hypothetical protein
MTWQHSWGWAVARGDGLAMHLCLYCGAAACFASGSYYLMQPTRLVNPGLAAYKPPPRTVIAHAPPLKLEREAFTPVARSSRSRKQSAHRRPNSPNRRKPKPK